MKINVSSRSLVQVVIKLEIIDQCKWNWFRDDEALSFTRAHLKLNNKRLHNHE